MRAHRRSRSWSSPATSWEPYEAQGSRSAPGSPGRDERTGGLGGPVEGPGKAEGLRSAPGSPGRDERTGGLGGPVEAPHLHRRSRMSERDRWEQDTYRPFAARSPERPVRLESLSGIPVEPV